MRFTLVDNAMDAITVLFLDKSSNTIGQTSKYSASETVVQQDHLKDGSTVPHLDSAL